MTMWSTIAPPLPSLRSPLSPVHTFARWPARDRDREVVHPRRPIGLALYQCVCQEMLVVAFGKVGSLVRAAGFFSSQGGFDDRLRNVEHPRQLEQRQQFGIERVAVIVD